MESQKALILKELNKLNSVSFIPKASVKDLHNPKNHLVNRAQRQSNRNYRNALENRKQKLNNELGKIETYEQNLAMEKARRQSLMSDWESSNQKTSSRISFGIQGVQSMNKSPRPNFDPLDQTIKKPNVNVGKAPMRKMTRFARMRQRGNTRY